MKDTIMVDMDDVIVTGGFLHLINEYLQTDYKQTDFKSFYMQDVLPNKEEFFKWFKDRNMYDFSSFMPGALEVLKRLNEFYDITICTAYLFNEEKRNGGIRLLHKFNFLYDFMPFIKPENFIFTSRKDLINTNVKIDDNVKNLRNAKIKLLFNSYHNTELNDEVLNDLGIERVMDWYDIEKKLIKK